MVARIKWVGHVLDEHGMYPDPEKLKCIKVIPIPQDKEELRKYIHLILRRQRLYRNAWRLARA
jgi:hypothetical protein